MRHLNSLLLCCLLLTGCGGGSDSTSQTDIVTTAPQLSLQPQVGAVKASWTAVPNATGYRLYWRDGYNTPTAIEVGESLGYDQTGLISGQTYYYRVAALDQAGTEHLSDEMGATVPFPPVVVRQDLAP